MGPWITIQNMFKLPNTNQKYAMFVGSGNGLRPRTQKTYHIYGIDIGTQDNQHGGHFIQINTSGDVPRVYGVVMVCD